jgi:glycerol kinase
MAGLGAGLFKNLDEIKKIRRVDRVFYPSEDGGRAEEKYRGWKKALERALEPV